MGPCQAGALSIPDRSRRLLRHHSLILRHVRPRQIWPLAHQPLQILRNLISFSKRRQRSPILSIRFLRQPLLSILKTYLHMILPINNLNLLQALRTLLHLHIFILLILAIKISQRLPGVVLLDYHVVVKCLVIKDLCFVFEVHLVLIVDVVRLAFYHVVHLL